MRVIYEFFTFGYWVPVRIFKQGLTMRFGMIAGALALATAAPAYAATTIDTTGSFTGDWTSIGNPNTATYGQTFTVGADNTLNSFSMYLDQTPQNPYDFKAYIYAWDGSKATGSALYTSGIQTFSGTNYGNPQEFAFNTGNTGLVSGSQYVAFLSTSGLQAGKPFGTSGMPYAGSFGSDAMPGGGFVYLNNGDNFGLLTSSAWNQTGQGDVWFKATFNAVAGGVPEPSTWAMMIFGFGAVGGAMRTRRRRTAAFA